MDVCTCVKIIAQAHIEFWTTL